ncbi:ATP-dependent helicase [Kitasatospora sp. RG8]|uniref:ATP-dependent helicase n=1 Tax=Kitasatospora sp. RG8 TaxID=2820815 RepID=UPI001ADF0DAF|nr:ATP-dependent helicase [Kitasatospora sp. RG8]MBP0453647.1 ATP-dependent helicase [Kitasatospora sp. RG8]
MAPQTHPQPPADPLAGFAPATRAWFTGAFHAPTTAQAEAWHAIGQGTDVLVVAPTGSGKTLAAFLSALDRLSSTPVPAEPKRRCRVLYISPLKALAVDVERNLRAPLAGLRQASVRLGLPEPDVQVGIRSGDTPAADRRRFATHPPDILITTPESLFLLLTSASREALRGIDTVILDEVHAVAGTKRGAHLALSLERLDELLERPARRIGLSATVRPVEEVARFLSPQRGATVVQPASAKEFDLSVVVPVPDLDDLPAAPGVGGAPDGDPARLGVPPGRQAGGTSIWPHVEERIVDLVQAHRSTIVFANSRRLAERLCNRLNEIAVERATGTAPAEAHAPAQLMGGSGAARGAPPVIARAHHGSVSKEQRTLVEEELKAGRLPAVVATSSLELGIDMGAVELVVQVESPPSVASGLQRVGRAGHQVGAVSTGVFFPKYRGDLVQSAVVTERMRAGRIEALRIPRNPLDVLAQQLVAMTALDTWPVDDLLAVVRRAAPFAGLPQSAFDAVLDMLAGRYPSDAFAELRPRLVWDRVAGTVTGRPGAQRLAVTSGGTIPDRGLFGVFIAGSTAADSTTGRKGGGRVGELDEEMVYESRVGDVFTLGTTSWRIEEITHDKVLVTPAPGIPGRLPFWKGDTLGRPLELGRALGAFTRELGSMEPAAATARLRQAGLDDWAAGNLLDYLTEQRTACGHLPDDRTIVVERFRDELGDWRIVIHSPFGAQVHAPWALALAARLREKHGLDPQVMHADDGIVLRLPDADLLAPDFDFGSPGGGAASDDAPVGADAALFDPGEIEQLVTDQVGGSALFASRFRECAGRALLLPRRSPGRRTPLWQQRQRAAQLLEVASEYGSFPIVLEAVRECLQDVFDVPGLVELMGDLESRAVRLVEVTTPEPSPFARSLLFGYVAQFLYEGDSPLAERRAAALSLDSRLLSELLGQAELRELLDPQVLAELEAELQRLTPERRIRDAEGVADALRLLGPLTEAELTVRGADPLWALELEAARRVIAVRIAGEQRWAAVEDAGRLRDALGTPLPVGVPEAFTEPVKDPLGDLLARHARTHGPFTAAEAAARFGLGTAVVTGTLHRLTAAGRLVQGEFRPVEGHTATVEWCDAEVLRRLRRRSLAALRQEVEAVPPRALAAFLPQWQHLAGHRLRGPDGLLRVVEQLQGTALPASALEKLILPARLADYSPNLLDELMAAGEIGWSGAGALPGKDGWISLHLAETAHLLRPEPVPPTVTPVHTALMEALAGGYGLFFRQLVAHLPDTPEAELVEALWDLVWAGYVSNDTLAPLRALLGSGRTAGATAHRAPRATPRGRYGGAGRPFGRIGGALRSGPPTVAGRWSVLPAFEADPTVRATARAQNLLDRHGLLTRGTVVAERVPGGFAGVYRVLAAMEERGRARRGYFVEGLGGAQFAMEGAADRLRSVNGRLERARANEWSAGPAAEPPQVLVLAAADPANAYGAALPWPEPPGAADGRDGAAEAAEGAKGSRAAKAHRPGRKAGALVVLVDGELALYVERGGKSLLAWPEDEATRALAASALASAVRAGALGSVTVERANGEPALGSALGAALEEAGFHATPRGLRLRP